MNLRYLPLLLISFSSVAQSVVYQGFEVDTAAEPRGGMAYLNTYLTVNLHKPVAAEAAGAGGRVILKAVVEADGRVSDVAVLRSLRPDCDREAVRVFGRFAAWQPARKGGVAVRQVVNIPVTFAANAPFLYRDGARILYADADRKPLPDSTELARYKQLTPLDSLGIPVGDVVILERSSSRAAWQSYNRLPLVSHKSGASLGAKRPLRTVGVQLPDGTWFGAVYDLDNTGAVVSEQVYEAGKPVGPHRQYHPNGLVSEQTTPGPADINHTTWYPTGQIRRVWTVDKKPSLGPDPERVVAVWDSAGRQLVKDGTGHAVYIDTVESRSDTARQTQFVEEGEYLTGRKQGRWTGHYADGSYMYAEQYDEGVCQGGKAITAGQDTLRYTMAEQPPEFQGGMKGLGSFLGQNIQYPPRAQRAGVQGRVFVSFVICTDGSLCDYEVLKGIHPDVDAEALRVVKNMSGRWKPGTQRGRKVRVKYNLPVSFTLE